MVVPKFPPMPGTALDNRASAELARYRRVGWRMVATGIASLILFLILVAGGAPAALPGIPAVAGLVLVPFGIGTLLRTPRISRTLRTSSWQRVRSECSTYRNPFGWDGMVLALTPPNVGERVVVQPYALAWRPWKAGLQAEAELDIAGDPSSSAVVRTPEGSTLIPVRRAANSRRSRAAIPSSAT